MILKRRVAIITGGTRGIGFAIAQRLAREGARLVIASKTTEPHPKLEGTIYTAAQALRKLGAEVLSVPLDVRDDEHVERVVQKTVDKWGKIDILVNNASAIFLADCSRTPMKRYDLMQDVNTRGTFAMAQACLPYLKKSTHAHILTLSPPLNLNPEWFGNHLAYTLSKYGMSMCTVGLAAELKDQGVGVNSLWPQTAIATAAIKMLGGEALMHASRHPSIVADAAGWILSQNPRQVSGRFFIDEAVLQEAGVTDFADYAVAPGNPLAPDFFLD